MTLDPALAPFLPVPLLGRIDDYPAFRATGLAGERALMEQVAEPGPDGGDRQVARIRVAGGEIDLAIHRPGARGRLPLHLYIHGGGWIAGSAFGASTQILAAERAAGAQCVVIAPDYRKAPAWRFPVALEDCLSALEWSLGHADALGIDPARVTVGGASAGGNLAAALALKVRDLGGPAIALQLLEIPTLDLHLGLPSHADPQLGTRYALHASDFRAMIEAYMGAAGDPLDAYASPLLAPSLVGVPPAAILVAEYDLLRDDGVRYQERLRDAGIRSELYLGRGLVHGSQAYTALTPAARAWRDVVLAALRAAHDTV